MFHYLCFVSMASYFVVHASLFCQCLIPLFPITCGSFYKALHNFLFLNENVISPFGGILITFQTMAILFYLETFLFF